MNASLSKAELQQTEAWWSQLSEAKQVEIIQLYDVESKQNTKDREEDEGLEFVPIAVHGEFVEELNSKRREWINNDYWRQGFVEYVMNQDDRDFMQVFIAGRRFHFGGVCMAHPKAKKALKQGFISANYTCPYQDKACPMRKLLNVQPGKSLRLLPKFKV